MAERIVLVDSNSLVYRGYFALPPLTTTRGELVNATFGFTSILLKALQEVRPDYVAAALDLPGPTFRHERDVRYKATRRPMPDDLRPQMERCKEVLEALGVPMYAVPGLEADDVIATLALQAVDRGLEAIILSGDLDTLQMVRPGIKLMTTRQGFQNTVVYDEAAIQERYGLRPDQMIEFKALKGDATDNVPGVPGVGEKTAAKLVAEHGSLEGVYEHVEAQTPRLRAALAEHRDQTFASRELVRLVTDAPVALDQQRARRGPYDRERVVELFRDLEFRTLIPRLPPLEGPAVTTTAAEQPQLGLGMSAATPTELTPGALLRPEDAAAVAERISRAKAVSLAAEVSPAARHPTLTGLGLAIDGAAWFLEVDGTLPPAIAEVLADPGVQATAHDLKTLRRALRRGLTDLGRGGFDTMLASYLVNAERRQHLLDDLAAERLKCELPTLPQPTRKDPNLRPTLEERVARGAASADATRRLAALLEADLEALGLRSLHDDVELPVVDVLVEMEESGIAVDVPYLATLATEFAQEIARVEREAYEAVGHQFQINSPKQLQELLFVELKLPRGRRTMSGGYSTDAQVLEELRGAHPVLEKILEYREVTKLKSTYADALVGLIDPETGRVHTRFNQAVATTGRLSSDSPNLQNIPIRSALGRRIRRAFVAGEPDSVLVTADYSQIELRVLAHVTGDPELIASFRQGADIHTRTAAAGFGVAESEVTREMRDVAKMLNFGIVYGMSDFGLSWRMGMPREQAHAFIEEYFRRYPQVRKYVVETKEQCLTRGYVETLLGRRRYIPDITSPNNAVRGAAERMAINMPIQGTAADLMKIAMARVRRRLRGEARRARLVLQVHDELVVEAPRAEVDAVAIVLREEMGAAYPLQVPLEVGLRAGRNWDEMAEMAEARARAS